MDYIEISGKTVDDALTEALVKLETTSDKVDVEVVEKGSSGILGLFNKPAVIRVRRKKDKDILEEDVVAEVFHEEAKKEEPAVVPAISTADTPTLTRTCSSLLVLKCNNALQTGSRLPLSMVIESVTSV